MAEVLHVLQDWLNENAYSELAGSAAGGGLPGINIQLNAPADSSIESDELKLAPLESPQPDSLAGGYHGGPNKPGASVRNSPEQAPASQGDQEEAQSSPNKHLPLIVGGAIAGVVTISAIVLLGMWFLFSGGDDSVAQTQPTGNNASPNNQGDSTAAADAAKTNKGDGGVFSQLPKEGSITLGQPTPEEIKAKKAAAAELEKGKQKSKAKQAAKAKKETPKKKAPEKKEVEKTAPPKKDPKPDEAAKKKMEAKKKAEATKKKPTPKPVPKPAPPKNPLQGFAGAVQLPAIESTEPFEMGLVRVNEKDPILIKIRGGENASKDKSAFSLRKGDSGLAERDWEVVIKGSVKSPNTTQVLALLALKDQKLIFQWVPGAGEVSETGYLQNCVFNITAGNNSHAVALRQAMPVESPLIDLDKRSTPSRWKIDFPPDSKSIKFELLSIEGDFPPEYNLEPEVPVGAKDGTAWVRLMVGEKKNSFNLLSFKVEGKTRNQLQFTTTPYYLLVPGGDDLPWNLNKLKKDLPLAQRENQRLLNLVAQGKQQLAKAPAAQKPAVQQQITNLEQQQVKVVAAIDNMRKLGELYAAINGKGRIHFRIFYEADEKEVDLLRTIPSDSTAVIKPTPLNLDAADKTVDK